MDINGDIYRCPPQEFELCVRMHTCLCVYMCISLSLSVSEIAVSLRCSLWPFDPQLRVKPWQMRWSSPGQICKHSTTIFSRPPPHIHHSSPPFSSSVSLIYHPNWRKSLFQTTVFYCVCNGNADAHTHQIRNYSISWTWYSFVLCSQRGKKQHGSSTVNLWTLKANHVCHKSLSVMSKMRNAAVFFLFFPGCSISDSISHSASLTPSALLQNPHIFSILSPPSPFLFLCSLTTLHLLHSPAQSQSLTPLVSSFSSHYFHWFF